MKKLCKKEKQQTRLAGLLLLMRYSLASAAANTCVRNLVCHNRTLLYLPVLSIYEEICPCTALADPSEIISLTAF